MDRLNSNGEMLSQIELEKLPYSSFGRSNHNFGTGKLGKLIVTRTDEVYPGDKIVGRPTAVVNFEPLAGPIMANMILKQESFFVPWYQVWRKFDRFITGKKGFEGRVPSISPRSIFRTFALRLNVFPYFTFEQFETMSESASITTGYAIDVLNNIHDFTLQFYNRLVTTADTYDVRDLYQPIIDLYQSKIGLVTSPDDPGENPFFDFMNSLSGLSISDRQEQILDYLLDYQTELFNILFGLSTHADYLGFPVMDNWYLYFQTWKNAVLDSDAPSPSDIENCFSDIPLSWLKFRAAYLVWYWNYRDELLETKCIDPEEDVFLGDTITDAEVFQLWIGRVRCWFKDSFTTALTNTGDGNLSVPIVGGVVDDSYDTQFEYYNNDGDLINVSNFQDAIQSGAYVCRIVTQSGLSYKIPMNYLSGNFYDKFSFNNSNDAISLSLFDRIRRLQKVVQKRLIVGTEIDDVAWSSFLVRMSNKIMRIPEILSRGRDLVEMNTIVNNTTTGEQIAGDKTAVAWAKGTGSYIDYFSEQWGCYIQFMTIMPEPSYTGGLSRDWLKLDSMDFMWPEYATLGLDAVYNYELSAPRGSQANIGLSDLQALQVFGYQGRYYDLKSKLDECHGRMRSDLNYLTFSREFSYSNPPKLNYIFVHCHPRTDMFVVDDPNMDVFRYDVYNDLNWRRRLPVPSEIV